MKHFRESCYEAYTNSDTTEGRGSHVTIGYFLREMDAQKAARGKGVMGTNGGVRYVELDVRIFDNYVEFEESKIVDKRESLLCRN